MRIARTPSHLVLMFEVEIRGCETTWHILMKVVALYSIDIVYIPIVALHSIDVVYLAVPLLLQPDIE